MAFANGIINAARFFMPSGIVKRPPMTPAQASTILANNTGDAYASAMKRGRHFAFVLAPVGVALTGLTTTLTEELLATNLPTPIALSCYGPMALISAAMALYAGVEALRVHDLRRDVRYASELLAAMGDEQTPTRPK